MKYYHQIQLGLNDSFMEPSFESHMLQSYTNQIKKWKSKNIARGD